MKTMKIACRRFEKQNPGWKCHLDVCDSTSGNYHVYIGNKVAGSWYWFTSIKGFRFWARYVIA